MLFIGVPYFLGIVCCMQACAILIHVLGAKFSTVITLLPSFCKIGILPFLICAWYWKCLRHVPIFNLERIWNQQIYIRYNNVTICFLLSGSNVELSFYERTPLNTPSYVSLSVHFCDVKFD